MTNDIILEVKKAEQNATRIEKEAKDQRDSMIEKASTEAKDMLAKAISETRQKNKDALEKVEAEGEKAIQMGRLSPYPFQPKCHTPILSSSLHSFHDKRRKTTVIQQHDHP